jgi:translocation and assembly module TamB
VSGARVEALVTGRLLAPSFDVQVDAGSVEAPAVKLSAVSAHGRMTVDSGVAFHDVQIDFAGERPPVRASAALVSVRGGSIELDGGLLEGLGAPLTAEVRGSSAALTVRAKTAGIDLARVASFAAIPMRRGTLSLSLDTTVISHSAEGRVELDLAHGVVGSLKDASAHLEAVLHGRRAHGRATVTVDDIGTIEAHSTSLTVGKGGLLTSTPWRNAWGALDVTARADLARLAARFPAVATSVGSLEGQIEVAARVARDSQEDMTPEVDVTVRTAGLVVSRRGTPGGWRLDGVDPVVHVVVNGDTGKTAVDAQLNDAQGVLATLKATSSSIPYSAIFSAEGISEALLSTPFTAELEVPQRSLASLPVGLGQSGRRGDLSARVDWRGALANPNVSFTAELVRGRADPTLVALPVDLSVTGQYQNAQLEVHMRGSQRGVAVAEATATVSVSARDWIDRGAEAAWAASGQATLEQFPLRSLDVLDDRQVRGSVSGTISLDRLHDDANASAELDFDSLQVGEVACKSARLTAKVDGHDLQSKASLDLADGGSIVAQLSAGTHWGAALLPRIDTAQLATASLKAKQFRAEILLPWLSGVTELDGRIDADASAELDGEHQVVRPRGTLALRDGTLELGWMGTEFHGISGNAVLTPDGIIRLQDVIAHGTTGTLRAALTGRILGTTLGGANATVQIPRSDPLPLVVAGAQLGKVDGRFDLTMKRSSHQNDIEVSVPSMTVALSSASSSRDVQDLGEVAGVRVGRVSTSEFILEPLDATSDDSADPATRKPGAPAVTPTVIDIRLGQDVEVRKGTDLDVRLEGNPKVTIGPGVRVSGQIRLVRGTLDVQGKPFEIEKGTVAFVEADPANPQVVLSAGWTAPDGTRVYASFVGPLKTGKVTLRSEPARPQNEILALILFGTTDQSAGANPQSNSVAAAAGGVATQPLNHALGGVNQALDKLGLAGGISTKVDTSTPNPRPEVQVQIARDISLQVAWVLGSPPPGTNPDTTLVTLDWRFLRKWALETTVGDAGTSIVDVLWQHRY